ncbi:MAG: asparagine synthase-related protein [Acidobacteriota bacterium]
MLGAGAYGFVVSARLAELRRPRCVRETHGDGRVMLASDGLSIAVRPYACTPEAVHEVQPIETGTTVLAYEGRVDNRAEVARLLERPDLARAADGDVLAAAFEAWGPALSARVIGEYAYVALDRRTRQLAAGQDSLGVRRVFYTQRGDEVRITSNLAFLFEIDPEARPAFDGDVLREYFAGIMSPWSGRTIWRGIRELGRGKALVQQDERLREAVVWQPRPVTRAARQSAVEVEETFAALLREAVGAALRSPGPVLCDLSGGYDSSTICAMAARLCRDGAGPGVVAWSYATARSGERRFQEAVREQFGVDHHLIDLERHLPFQAFSETELPAGGYIQFGAVDRAVRAFAGSRGLRSRLTGYGADALLLKGCPPPVYLAEWLREGRLIRWARHVAAHLAEGSVSAWHLLGECTVGSLDPLAGTFRAPLPDWLTPAFRSAIRDAHHDYLYGQPRVFESDARERVYRATLHFIPYHGRVLPDERRPFVYRPLVEFLLGLDWAHLARPGEDRWLLRRAFRHLLPDALHLSAGRSRHGGSLLDGLRANWPRLERRLTGDQLAALGVVEPEPFRRAVRAMRAGYTGPNTRCSNTALYLEPWLHAKAAGRVESPAWEPAC